MYKPYVTVEVEEITAAAIDAALKKATGLSDWISDEDDLKRQLREGFIRIEGKTVTILEDVME